MLRRTQAFAAGQRWSRTRGRGRIVNLGDAGPHQCRARLARGPTPATGCGPRDSALARLHRPARTSPSLEPRSLRPGSPDRAPPRCGGATQFRRRRQRAGNRAGVTPPRRLAARDALPGRRALHPPPPARAAAQGLHELVTAGSRAARLQPMARRVRVGRRTGGAHRWPAGACRVPRRRRAAAAMPNAHAEVDMGYNPGRASIASRHDALISTPACSEGPPSIGGRGPVQPAHAAASDRVPGDDAFQESITARHELTARAPRVAAGRRSPGCAPSAGAGQGLPDPGRWPSAGATPDVCFAHRAASARSAAWRAPDASSQLYAQVAGAEITRTACRQTAFPGRTGGHGERGPGCRRRSERVPTSAGGADRLVRIQQQEARDDGGSTARGGWGESGQGGLARAVNEK